VATITVTIKLDRQKTLLFGNDWSCTMQKRQKISRFYIYGINKKVSSEADMRDYLQRENVRVTFLTYFEKKTGSVPPQLN